MPANLSVASPSTVFPNSLFTSFTESLSFPMLTASYHDFTLERSLIVSVDPVTGTVYTPRAIRSWALSKRLTYTQLSVLRAFWLATDGGLRPFYFYPDPRQYDGTGSSPTGRIVAVFVGNWEQSQGPIMTDVPLSIREVA